MSLTFNGTAVKKLMLNGDNVMHLDYNGTRTWDAYRTMTVYIDESVADPELACTYGDDAVGMTPGSDAWDEFFGHYPVMLKDGVEGQKLQRNDFTKHEDGTAADITTGAEGDVMICFPRRGLSISRTGSIIKISMTDNLSKPGFEYMAHRRGDIIKDKFYAGAYRSYGQKIADDTYIQRSLAMGTISKYSSDNNTTALSSAQARGDGYDIRGFYQATYHQAMFFLKYKHTNCNSAIGIGKGVMYDSTGDYARTLPKGTSNQLGMDGHQIVEYSWKNYQGKEYTSTTDRIKLFGMEDLWGQTSASHGEFIGGILGNSRGNSDYVYVYTATTGFSQEIDANYERLGTIKAESGRIKRVWATDRGGFLRDSTIISGESGPFDFTSSRLIATNTTYMCRTGYAESTIDGAAPNGLLGMTMDNYGAEARLMYL